MRDELDPLRRQVRAERTGSWVGAIVFELFAIGIVLPFSDAFRQAINMAPLGGGAYVLGAFGLGLALTAAWFARRGLLARDVDRTPLMAKLLADPEDVVWVHAGVGVDYRVYGQTTQRTRFVSILCASREGNGSIEVREREVGRVLDALERHLPHATVGGFSQEALARYHEDPESFRLGDEQERREGAGYRGAAIADGAARRKKVALPRPPSAPYLLVAAACAALVPLGPLVCELALR